ncbi:MAG: PilN domain-containing protein [Burkholderiales bacterium]
MSRQINLYSPIFRKQKKHFSLSAMLISAAIVASGVVILYAYARVQTAAVARQSAAIETQLKTALAQLNTLSQDKTLVEKRKRIEDELKSAQAKLAAAEQLAAAIPEAGAAGGAGFSGVLTAFARRTVDGVWLTRIAVTSDEDGMTIAGRARSADLVPRYLARLREEEALSGRSFAKLQISTPAAAQRPDSRAVAAPYVEFTLWSSAEGAGEGAGGAR